MITFKKDERFKAILSHLDGNIKKAVGLHVNIHHDEFDVWSREEVEELTDKIVTEWQHTA